MEPPLTMPLSYDQYNEKKDIKTFATKTLSNHWIYAAILCCILLVLVLSQK